MRGGHAVTAVRIDPVGLQRPGRHRRQGEHQGLPGRARVRVPRRWRPGWSGRRRPATGRTRPPARARRAARRCRARPAGRAISVELGRRAWSPRLRQPRSGTPPRPGRGPGTSFSAAVLGRGARRGPVRAGPAVVVVDDAGLTRRDQRVLGEDLPGDRLDHPQRRRRRRATVTVVPISRFGTE